MRILLASAAIAALTLAACSEADDAAMESDAAEDMAMADDSAAMDDMADDAMADDAMDDDAGDAMPAAYSVPADAPANIRRAVESAGRTPEASARDVNRMPAEILMLAEIDEGDHVVEFAGFGQYYTTMLAEAVGPDGQVDVYDLPYTDAFAGEASREFAAAHDNVDYHQGEYDEMTLPSDVDAAMIVLYYHDLHVSTNTVDVAAFNQKVFDALAPGGTYVIIDHNAAAGSGMDAVDELHRIDPEVIRTEVTAAGFELAEESDLLARPEDTHEIGPFDPSIRGMTDRSVFKFVKPAG